MFLKLIIIIIGSFFLLLSLTSNLDNLATIFYLFISVSTVAIGIFTKTNKNLNSNDLSRFLVLSGTGLLIFAVIMAFRSLLQGDIEGAKSYSEIWFLSGFGALLINFIFQITKKN